MVKDFPRYLWLVIKRCFQGAFLLADGFGLLFLLLSKNQPTVPVEISLSIFGVIFIASSFAVWHDEISRATKLQAKLDKITDSIPKYKVTTGALERYSVSNLIKECADQLESTEAKISRQNAVEAANSSTAAIFKTLNRLSVLPLGLSAETLEEKAERLAKQLESLESYQQKINQTYKLPVMFESTRSDNNIEFQIDASEGAVLTVEDDYPTNELPKSYTPSLFGRDALTSYIPSGGFANANRLYPYSYAEGNIAYSKLTKINANRKYNLFDDDFYIQTTEGSVKLTVTIHSEKLQNKQVIELSVDLSDVPVEEISKEKLDD